MKKTVLLSIFLFVLFSTGCSNDKTVPELEVSVPPIDREPATHFVNTAMSDNNGDGLSVETAKKDIAAILPLLQPGNIVELSDGIYNQSTNVIDASNIPSGMASAWITFRAANDGKAIIETDFAIEGDVQKEYYVTFEGLKFRSFTNKGIQGKYWKFIRCAFEGGPLSNYNEVSFGVGSTEAGTSYGLFEECWFYGGGGRYKLMLYNSSKIVVRRCVFRNDGGWGIGGAGGNPETPFVSYSCSDIEVQNCIGIDAVYRATGSGGSMGVFSVNNNDPIPGSATYFRGNIAINCEYSGYAYEGDRTLIDGGLIENCIAYNCQGNGLTMNTDVANLMVKHSVLMKSTNDGAADYGDVTSEQIQHTIIAENTGEPLRGISTNEQNNIFGNGGTATGTGNTTYNPRENGLLYPVRIESGSQLANDGKTFNITLRIGLSGTLYGEAGYNTLTTAPLWPFPNENRILNDFRSITGNASTGIVSGDRGFAATGAKSIDGSSQTLTKYIWESLGNVIPEDL